jgi:hypothetical protein
MMEAAGKIARRLRITGFFGLDFMIENGTGAVYLIEMNPRCTPPCPLSLGKGRNLVAALWSEMTGQPAPSNLPEIEQNFIAYFPKCGKGNGTDVNHHEPIHLDVPADEPELIRELLHPLSGRNVVGQLIDRMWRKQNQEPASVAVFKEKDNYTKKSVLGTLQ